jgi:hypothetical protein
MNGCSGVFRFVLQVNFLIKISCAVSFSSAYSERVFVGLSLFQGILFVPRINVPIVLKAGIYEEVLNSKLYNFDVGVKIGVGLMF